MAKIASNTTGYKVASEMLLNSMNFSVDPCVDFFEFTCGNWIEAHPIPEYLTFSSRFTEVRESVLQQMKDEFESPEIFSSKSMNAVKFMYQKCVNKEELTKNGSKRLLQTIRSYGVWPMIEGDDKFRVEDFNLTSLMIHITKARGFLVFVANGVTRDSKNASRRLIEFSQADLGLGKSTRDFYLDRAKHGNKIEAYKKLLISEVVLINEYDNRSYNYEKIAQDVDEIIDFETKVAKIMVAEQDRRNFFKMYNIRRLSELQKLMPMIDWTRYFYSIAPYSVHKYFANDPNVLIKEIDYLRRITELLQSTDPRIITNYIFIRFTSSWSEELGERFHDVLQEFHRSMYGRKQKVPSWKECAFLTINRMPYSAGAIFVSEVYDKASKNVTLDMVNDLIEAFNEMLAENDWMDKSTKKTAYEKAKELLKQIAYPDFILDSKKLDIYYKGVSSTISRAISYGGLGSVVGHEITHGFDDKGQQFDAAGNLRDWWDAEVKKKFVERAQCMIDQYGKIEVPGTGLNINGKLTLGENIADNGGIKQALKAYRKYLRKHGEEKRIEGLEQYNNEQMFFIGYASIWCGHYTKDALVSSILTDTHPPSKYRVNQVLANQPEFAEAFKCAVGTPMNPRERCTVW
nr:Peptidase M13 domain containing protein [Haemonchus contortus]